MSLNVWNIQSGLLATVQEGQNINLQLPSTHTEGIEYAVISGKLPPGLWLHENYIKGTPYEVSRATSYSCCIRAKLGFQLSDRTFSIIVEGVDDPVILTPAGLLDVGPAQQLYVIDNSFVNYQIQAIDSDTAAGQTLTYYINPAYGTLPPGLSITKDGIIYGIVKSVTSLSPADGTGTYDSGLFDVAPYDFAHVQHQNGYDVIPYDKAVYDYFISLHPKTINRRFRFRVFVTDGQTTSPPSKEFEIFVVNDNFFRADSDASVANVDMFTADVTYLSKPVWLTKSALGTYRADNYVTLVLDVYDTGLIYYTLEQPSKVWTPNTAYKENDLIYNSVHIPYICKTAHTSGNSLDLSYWTKYGIPPGMKFDDKTGEIFGKVPEQPAMTVTYTFTVTASRHGDETKSEIASTSKTFNVNIIGNIESAINWTTNSDLGSIDAGFNSTLYVKAISSFSNGIVTHIITDGTLPPGLTLKDDGEIIGVVSQFSNTIAFDQNHTTFYSVTNNEHALVTFDQSNVTLGLTTFSNNFTTNQPTIFDNGKTSFDRKFTFTVKASDESNYSAISKTFTLMVNTPYNFSHSNIRVKPFLTPKYAAVWNTFINSSVFTFESLYRPYDSAYGLQTNLEMLIFEGIKTVKLSNYVPSLNYKTKQFHFGNIKKAIACLPGTKTIVYEVVYIEMIDPTSTNTVVEWRTEFSKINNPTHKFLPLWMQTVQPSDRKELGFILAIPLCYCKAGTADSIILNIKHSNFDFKMIDYRIDRFIINAVEGSNTDKYIIFNNKES